MVRKINFFLVFYIIDSSIILVTLENTMILKI
nr:MAG TPA: hypothetical protein [Caudoviricetes sp.]